MEREGLVECRAHLRHTWGDVTGRVDDSDRPEPDHRLCRIGTAHHGPKETR